MRKRTRSARLRATAGVLGVAAIFTVALVLWAGGGSEKSPVPRPTAGANGSTSFGQGTAATAPPPLASGTTAPATGGTGAAGARLVPTLTAGIDAQSGVGHQVVITVTSDTTINAFGYRIIGGKPPTGAFYGVRSPAVVRSPAYGNGATVAVQAQASLYAQSVTCSISIDGGVRSHNTAKGPYGVAVCVA